MNNTYPEILQKLTFLTKTQEFGSRALGVEHDHSDYDFVFIHSTELHDSLFELPECELGDIDNYMPIHPSSFFYYYKLKYKNYVVDLIGLTSTRDFEAVRAAIEDMQLMPKTILEVKSRRTQIYRALLKLYGWEYNLEAIEAELEYAEKGRKQ